MAAYVPLEPAAAHAGLESFLGNWKLNLKQSNSYEPMLKYLKVSIWKQKLSNNATARHNLKLDKDRNLLTISVKMPIFGESLSSYSWDGVERPDSDPELGDIKVTCQFDGKFIRLRKVFDRGTVFETREVDGNVQNVQVVMTTTTGQQFLVNRILSRVVEQ
eukprot:Filipodium_phascolosomae@DN8052_c0_g1_i1.p1